ncbi:glycoside hydrolase family 20 zincin-like fold domain-containing protein, partial [Actinoplanes digitatis]
MIPRPASVVYRDGGFALPGAAPLFAEPGLEGVAAWLSGLIPAGGIALRLAADLPPEGYVLDVGRRGVDIRGGSPAGVFYGAQTLRQLLPAATLRAGTGGGP